MYDAVIIGGGPAGAVAGMELARANQSVLILQSDLYFKKPCGGGLRMDAFDEFDLNRSSITRIVNEIVMQSNKVSVEFDISQSPLAIVDRVKFDRGLRDAAGKAGATIVQSKVTDIRTDAEKVYIETKDKIFESRYAIAADGVGSVVRKKMGLEDVPRVLTHYIDTSDLETDKCYFYFDTKLSRGAYGWRFPYADSGTDAGVVSCDGSRSYIDNLVKKLDLRESIDKIRGYYIPQWKRIALYSERVFYVGDAAGLVLPFTYEGIYYAMKSGKIAAKVISDGVDPYEYEKRWNELYLNKFTLLDRLQNLFLKNSFMVHLMMKTVEKPRVKQKVIQLWMGEYDLNLNAGFYMRVVKRLFSSRDQ